MYSCANRDQKSMKHQSFLCLAFLIGSCLSSFSQISYSANDFDHVFPYNGYFMYGTNPGYYGGTWDDKSLADIAAGNPLKNVKGVGAKTFRPSLPEDFLESWTYDIRISEFTHYATLGVADNTVFLGGPSAAHKDNNKYGGCANESSLFKNMYEPIWDGGANGTPVNENNFYALYVYKTVTRYKSFVKFWEIINEPDYDGGGNGWRPKGQPGNWWDNNPSPCELPNMNAPVFHYIRLLRISYEVIKSIDPTAYIATGGLGYTSFLDAILRNTDNPADGSVSSAHPLKGGAYFDVLSFHSYPMFNLSFWDDAIGGRVYKRHSDAAATEYVKLKQDLDAVLASRGYNGTAYPKKQFICTENNIPKKPFGDMIGSDDAQVNYMLKTLVESQKYDIKQYYTFVLGDAKTLAEATNAFHTMGLYQKLENNGPRLSGVYRQQYNNEGIAFRTCSELLRQSRYDAVKTAAMNLPATVGGAAFRDVNGAYTYVLWAKTITDLTEISAATYSFPAAMNVAPLLHKREWNYTEMNLTTTIPSLNVALTGTPVFLSEQFQLVPLPEKPPPSKEEEAVRELALALYPNPVSTTASLRFSLRKATEVRVTIHASDGKLIAVAIPGRSFAKGTHIVPLAITQQLASGVYYCRFEADIMRVMTKLVIAR